MSLKSVGCPSVGLHGGVEWECRDDERQLTGNFVTDKRKRGDLQAARASVCVCVYRPRFMGHHTRLSEHPASPIKSRNVLDVEGECDK